MSRDSIAFHRLSPEEKKRVLRIIAEELSKESDIVFAVVFGSFTRNTPFRDIDIVVLTRTYEQNPIDSYIKLRRIAERIEARIKIPVDIVDIVHAPDTIRRRALLRGIVIIDRDPLKRASYILQAIDTKWLEEALLRKATKKTAKHTTTKHS